MKKLALFALAALAAGLFGWLPFRAVDCSELVVVQVLAVAPAEDGVTVFAPDGLSGTGDSLTAALSDLAAHAPGTLFLGAAEHLIVSDGAAAAIADAARADDLRPAVRLYATALDAGALMEDAAGLTAYLRAHPGTVRLGDVRAARYDGTAVHLPALRKETGGYATV